jgi:hypothetical protein
MQIYPSSLAENPSLRQQHQCDSACGRRFASNQKPSRFTESKRQHDCHQWLPSMAAINGRCRDTSSRESTSRSVDGAECMQSLATVATMATRCNLMQLFRECCNPVGFATSRQGTRSFPRWSRVCPAKQVVGNSNVS